MHLALLVGSLALGPLPGPIDFIVVHVPPTNSPRRLAAADLDGDGFVDLMVAQAGLLGSPLLQVYHNAGGTGLFPPGWSRPWFTDGSAVTIFDVDLADTDGDGDKDVVYCVSVGAPGQRFNDGHGNFDAVGLVPTASVRFENELLDMNDNGTVDLIYYEPDFFFDTYFGTQLGVGNGSFQWAIYTEIQLSADLEPQRRIALGDITGDGLTDAVFTSVVNVGLRFFQGTPPPVGKPLPAWELSPFFYAPPCSDAVMADLDRDGRLDLIASAPSLDAIVVFITEPTGVIGHPRVYAAGVDPGALVAADFDLDGVPDVMVANPASSVARVFRGTGDGSLEAPRLERVGPNPRDLAAADFDNDGDLDVAVASANHVALLYNQALKPGFMAPYAGK